MSAYSPYDLLRTLIHRTSWPSEAEINAALTSVDEYEAINMFGNLAHMMACKHDPRAISSPYRGTARCMDCGRIM